MTHSRRTVLLIVAIVIVGAVTLFTAHSVAQPDWPTFGTDATNDGSQPDATGPRNDTEPLWTFDVESDVRTGITVVDDAAYFGIHHYDGTPAKVYAVNTTTGEEVWNVTTPGNSGFRSTPTVANGRLYIAAFQQKLYALNATTGAEVWNRTVTPGGSNYAGPTVVDNTVYYGSPNGTVFAFDAASGVTEWSTTIGGKFVLGTPAVDNGTLYVGRDGTDPNVYALNTTTGVEDWRYSTTDGVRGAIVVTNGSLYAVDRSGYAYSLDLDGNENWKRQIGGGADMRNPPAVWNDTVYVGDWNGDFYALDAADGSER